MSHEKSWREIAPAGVCFKSSLTFLTGDWKTYMPIRDREKCTLCLLCVLYCPDAAINWRPDKQNIEFDYNYCKGCGICANECPTKAITMKLPEE
jgi:2-oxoacid:acceptor oxidoreductase delta subunit (pyruvate/2-ketoisovalerate family)